MSRRLLHVAAILGLVLGQWLAVVHATRHELQDAGKQTHCEVCVISHGAAPPPAIATLPPLQKKPAAVCASRQPVEPTSRLAYRPPSRGPPASLA
jgi:hypothetical protein